MDESATTDIADTCHLARSHLTREEWYDSWTEELVTTYHILIDHCSQYGLPFFENFSFSDFIDVAYASSDKTMAG
jgi:hypothetical protein